MVTGDDVSRGKPDREAYALALERLHADPRASFAMEDSENGAASALAAGVPTFYLVAPAATPPLSVPVVAGLAELLENVVVAMSRCGLPLSRWPWIITV